MDGAGSYFSTDYADARRKFLDAARDASARIQSFVHPLIGPGGEELATDVADFGPVSATNALFVCSATHGVEGFAGSGIQIGLIRQSWQDRLRAGTRLVLIHAINPYGFAWLRRFNEDNIDLNRNFLEPGDIRPENSGYDALAQWLAPRSISPLAELGALGHLFLFRARHGIFATRKAVTGGQYRHADGLFFGGEERSWSARTLKTIIQTYGAGVSRAVFIDVHTGLGPHGAAELVSNSPKTSEQYARACAIWGDRVKTTKAGESVSADLAGTLKLAVVEMLPEAEMTAASIEFGTVPSLQALRALRAENWLHRNGQIETSSARRIKRNLVAAFNPDSEAWRDAVWRQGTSAVQRAIDWLANTDPR